MCVSVSVCLCVCVTESARGFDAVGRVMALPSIPAVHQLISLLSSSQECTVPSLIFFVLVDDDDDDGDDDDADQASIMLLL